MPTGVILAGGKSRRFGRNKALEVFGGSRLIDRAVESLRPLCSPILVVANELELYRDLNVTLVRDIIPHQGPLGGIYTALLFSPDEWIFVKATDMPFLAPELVRAMLDRREGYDAAAPVCNGLFEPLLALYHRRCCPIIADFLEKGERKIVSFYDEIRVREITEDEWRAYDPDGLSFKNVNTVDDLERLEWS